MMRGQHPRGRGKCAIMSWSQWIHFPCTNPLPSKNPRSSGHTSQSRELSFPHLDWSKSKEENTLDFSNMQVVGMSREKKKGE